VPGGKTKTNHVFLRISVTFAEFLNSSAQGAKKLSFINHAFYLENLVTNGHEQISWTPAERAVPGRPVALAVVMSFFSLWRVGD
jgi:hypothetical protein